MKRFPLLAVLFLMIVPARQSFGQTPTSTPPTQTDSQKAASEAATTTKKPKKEKTAKAHKPAKAGNSDKFPTVPGEAAAYELSLPKPPPQVSQPK
jgi:hypothetical protein